MPPPEHHAQLSLPEKGRKKIPQKIIVIVKIKPSLRLDLTEIISVAVFGVFLWVPCIVHRTHKHGFQQI